MIVAALFLLAATAPAAPTTLTTAEADTVLAAIRKDRADTETWLKGSPTSYLAAVERVDFGARTALTIGRAPGNDVRLDADGIAARHVQVTVEGDRFHVKALDPAARFKVGDEERREATVGPSMIGVGRFLVRLSHQRFPALIVFDPQSPHFKDYKGLRYFPPDLGYRYAVALERNPRPDTVVILSTRGNRRRALRVGWFNFKVGSTPCRLEASRLLEPGVGESDLSVFFRDLTTGKETYAVGRYVDPKALPDGRYLLDFNLAYNPACAISSHYNCPIPPRANVLKVAIRAGEMDAHYH
ncbi:MAG TPA: DUF1684 domain-containing protein [Candidatus Eisenbacteria bacterium]